VPTLHALPVKRDFSDRVLEVVVANLQAEFSKVDEESEVVLLDHPDGPWLKWAPAPAGGVVGGDARALQRRPYAAPSKATSHQDEQ